MKWPRSAQLMALLLALTSITSTGVAAYLFYRVPDGPVFVGPEHLISLVQTNFPKQYESKTNPERLRLAFLLDRRKAVQATAMVEIAGDGERLDTSIAHAFSHLPPGQRLDMGALCFPAQEGKHGKFCAIWAMPTDWPAL